MIFVILLILQLNLCYGFSDLSSLQKYAAIFKEFPKPDNNDFLNPDFRSNYEKQLPSIFDQIKHFFGFATSALWNINEFKKLLHEYDLSGKKYNNILNLQASVGTKFIILGNIQGDFHSLVRILSALSEQHIIDKSLKILEENTYIIINGNIINGSSYNLETLTILLLLLKINPGKVIYLKGKNESDHYWVNLYFKSELKIKISTNYFFWKNDIPASLINNLDNFFDSFPSILYIDNKKPSDDIIRVSPSGIDFAEIKALKKSQNIKVNITSKQHEQIPTVLHGLDILEPDHGATSWAVNSSPIKKYQKFFGFYLDAFVVLTIASNINDSTLVLYKENISKKYFTQDLPKIITSGQTTNLAYTTTLRHDDILVGSSMALTSGVFAMGRKVKRGMSVCINAENKKGGIDGRLIRPMILDDHYATFFARKNIEYFLSRNIDTVLLPIGSPTLQGYLDLVKAGKILVLFPITGGPQFRQAELKDIIHIRASYGDEVRALIKHITQANSSIKKFLFFYQNDAYGIWPLQVAHDTLKELGITSWIDVPYNRIQVDFDKEAAIIKNSEPDAIGLFSAASQTQVLMRKVGVEHFINKNIFGISFLSEDVFRKYLSDHGINVIFSQVMPNPKTSNMEIVKEYRDKMDRSNFPYDVYSLEAYIATTLYIDILKKNNGSTSRDKFLEQVRSIKNYNFKGFELTFNPTQNSLSRNVWIERNDQDWEKMSH